MTSPPLSLSPLPFVFPLFRHTVRPFPSRPFLVARPAEIRILIARPNLLPELLTARPNLRIKISALLPRSVSFFFLFFFSPSLSERRERYISSLCRPLSRRRSVTRRVISPTCEKLAKLRRTKLSGVFRPLARFYKRSFRENLFGTLEALACKQQREFRFG